MIAFREVVDCGVGVVEEHAEISSATRGGSCVVINLGLYSFNHQRF